mmetsp:Transcript_18530/g.29951  ORF Transcript_18530/g.29951 Transcript_18530/m.29951 type:complete len:534 (-) Transcript_18530:553-2154(-)
MKRVHRLRSSMIFLILLNLIGAAFAFLDLQANGQTSFSLKQCRSLAAKAPTLLRSSIDDTSVGGTPDTPELDSDGWSPQSWRNKVDKSKKPIFEDEKKLEEAEKTLASYSPLVFAGECRNLHEALAKASMGNGFVLLGGEAESFEGFQVDKVRDTFRILLQMALILTYGGSMPVVKIGRMAGSFATLPKSEVEEKGGAALPSFHGDLINGEAFTPEARRGDPGRLVQAYHQSAQTLNLLRAFARGGYADIHRLHAWNLDFLEQADDEEGGPGARYRALAEKVEDALLFLEAVGVDTRAAPFTQAAFYTGHAVAPEALPYEAALCREDSTTGRRYACSAHLLWVPDREMRQGGGPVVEYLRGVANPVAVKVGPEVTPEAFVRVLDALNPRNTPGRVTAITRMGAAALRERLPALVRAAQKDGRSVVWVCDPMHANARAINGLRSVAFEDLRAELRAFFDVHRRMGSHPGGAALMLTGEDVTECVGGSVNEVVDNSENHAAGPYADPRLNPDQALELAFLIAARVRTAKGRRPLW